MPWKMDESGSLVKDDKGNPVWIHADGNETGFDYSFFSTAQKEAVQRKEKLREMEKALEPFKDISDPQEWVIKAHAALETVANAPDAQKAVEEQVRARVEAATKPLHDKLGTATKEAEALRQQLQTEAVGNAFARSAFVREKMIDPVMAADLFKGRFTMKDGQIVALGDDGQPIYGESGVASFDEAMMKLVESSPYKIVLLKGNTASGGGAVPASSGAGASKPKSLTECKTEAEKIALLKEKSAQGA